MIALIIKLIIHAPTNMPIILTKVISLSHSPSKPFTFFIRHLYTPQVYYLYTLPKITINEKTYLNKNTPYEKNYYSWKTYIPKHNFTGILDHLWLFLFLPLDLFPINIVITSAAIPQNNIPLIP